MDESRKIPFVEGQCLHARILGFIHPRTGEYMEFEAPLPDYFQELLKKLIKSLQTHSGVLKLAKVFSTQKDNLYQDMELLRPCLRKGVCE